MFEGFTPFKLNDYSYFAKRTNALFDSYNTSCREKGSRHLWTGETSGVGSDSTAAGTIIGTAVEILWYADKLGLAALHGQSVVLRQDWVEVGVNGPTTSFWLALFWKRLVGREVLRVDHQGWTYNLRRYAHKDSQGRVTLVLINLADTASSASVALQGVIPVGAHEEYHVTGQDGDVTSNTLTVNGHAFPNTIEKMQGFVHDGVVPAMESVLKSSSSSSVQVEPKSVVFVRFLPMLP
jgi:hypothetical protein